MATSMERINNIYSAKSPSWSNAEEEKKGRASIHESQCRRYSAAVSSALSEHMVSKEDQDADRAAAQKRKHQQDSELKELFESQQQANLEGAKMQPPTAFMMATKAKEQKAARLPGFLAVKKAKTSSEPAPAPEAVAADVGEESAPSSTPAADSQPSSASTKDKQDGPAAPAAGSMGLGDYGSSSDEDADEDEG